MKSLKLSFALLIAVLAVGVTVATKANFGKRVVTRCFFNVSLVDDAGANPVTLNANVTPRLSCPDSRTAATTSPYLVSASTLLSFPSSASCPDELNFCCALVTEIGEDDPGYEAAALIDLGEGEKKYKIENPATDIFCKNN